MALTKSAVRVAVQQMIDDPNGKRWAPAALDQLIELVMDDIWADILDSASYINSAYQQIQLPLRAPGYIDLRLDTYGGDLTNRFYRLQQVIADGRQYGAKDPRDYLMSATSNTGDVSTITTNNGVGTQFSFQFLGSQLWLHPLGGQTTFVELRYNYRPTAFTLLKDSALVEIPEGSFRALINLSAGEAMMKGNAEDGAALLKVGEDAREKLLNSIRRQYHGMTMPFTPDEQYSWGGV